MNVCVIFFLKKFRRGVPEISRSQEWKGQTDRKPEIQNRTLIQISFLVIKRHATA